MHTSRIATFALAFCPGAQSIDRLALTPEQRLRLDSLRRDPRLMLKRKMVTPGGTRVDTLIDTTAPR